MHVTTVKTQHCVHTTHRRGNTCANCSVCLTREKTPRAQAPKARFANHPAASMRTAEFVGPLCSHLMVFFAKSADCDEPNRHGMTTALKTNKSSLWDGITRVSLNRGI